MALNPEQHKASIHKDGPLIIVAGAGSGKTTTMMHRISNLVKKENVHPYNVVAVTFTKKAANEMRERIEKFLTEEQSAAITISTFHSFCVDILRREWKKLGMFDERFIIVEPSTSEAIIRYIIKGRTKVKPGTFAKYISAMKNEMVDAEAYKHRGSSNPYIDWDKFINILMKTNEEHKDLQNMLRDVYFEYDKIMKEKNQVDFDDLILLTVQLFLKDKDVLEKYQERFKYIMVDEYQDTNRAQYALMHLLGKKYNNVAVVGDDYQSIYKFRGSDIRNILTFDDDYKGTNVITLEQNYRSTKYILQGSNSLIRHNKQQRHKRLTTDKKGGKKIQITTARNDKELADYIAVDIQEKMKTKKLKANDFAVLYRTNAQSLYIEQALKYHRLPYIISSGRGFYDREEIQDILHYLAFMNNFGDINAFNRAIRKPKRRIAEKTIEKIAELAYDKNIIEVLKDAERIVRMQKIAKEESVEFVQLIEKYQKRIKTDSVADIVEELLKEIDYTEKVLKTYDKETRENKEENIETFLRDIRLKEEEKGKKILLEEFVEDIMLYQADDLEDGGEKVQLMTLHASKGLEFEHVYMIGLNEEVFPSVKSEMSGEIEEERRLCYVGMTRAKEELQMCKVRKRILKSGEEKWMLPSRFIGEIDPTTIEEFDI